MNCEQNLPPSFNSYSKPAWNSFYRFCGKALPALVDGPNRRLMCDNEEVE